MSGGTEDNPHDDEPIDREEYEKAMTPKPSDSLSERARDLVARLHGGINREMAKAEGWLDTFDYEAALALPILADAFNKNGRVCIRCHREWRKINKEKHENK